MSISVQDSRIRKIPPAELEMAGVIQKARRSGYICPCGNGGGEDGDGLSVQEYYWGYNYHCFGKCGKNYTAVELIGEYLGTASPAEIEKFAREKFNLDSLPFNEKRVAEPMGEHKAEKNIAPEKNSVAKEPAKDYSEFYKQAQKNLADFMKSTGEKIRGLNLQELQAASAGLATAAELKAVGENVPASAKCLILPYSKHRFLMRSISGKCTVKRGNKGGAKTEIYNPYRENFERALFVVEGEIDCLSIHAAGFPAVALSGAAQGKLLFKALASVDKNKVRLIILLDNNDSGAGQENAAKMKAELSASGYLAVNFILSPKNKYDANEYLQKDIGGLKARLTEIYSQANIEFEKLERLKMKAAGIVSLADNFDGLDELTNKLQGKILKWGFSQLDAKLPMLPGCYLLGALPSVGKTCFALNIAANICEQGSKVLYISYEPTLNQILVRDLARYWFMKIWNNHKDNRHPEFVPSASQIMLGKYNDFFGAAEMLKVREELKNKHRNFYFLQGERNTAQDLISKIQRFVDNGIKFLVVDYIQLIKGADSSKPMREQIDDTVREMQMFQAKNDLVILFISAFNRENYRNYACIESFKESGGLEYTADAILALQFEYSKTESRANVETFQQKKQAQPRDIELVCLKNRFGNDFVARFTYHSRHEAFIEKAAESTEPKRNKKAT